MISRVPRRALCDPGTHTWSCESQERSRCTGHACPAAPWACWPVAVASIPPIPRSESTHQPCAHGNSASVSPNQHARTSAAPPPVAPLVHHPLRSTMHPRHAPGAPSAPGPPQRTARARHPPASHAPHDATVPGIHLYRVMCPTCVHRFSHLRGLGTDDAVVAAGAVPGCWLSSAAVDVIGAPPQT